jgi:hypothetical protein
VFLFITLATGLVMADDIEGMTAEQKVIKVNDFVRNHDSVGALDFLKSMSKDRLKAELTLPLREKLAGVFRESIEASKVDVSTDQLDRMKRQMEKLNTVNLSECLEEGRTDDAARVVKSMKDSELSALKPEMRQELAQRFSNKAQRLSGLHDHEMTGERSVLFDQAQRLNKAQFSTDKSRWKKYAEQLTKTLGKEVKLAETYSMNDGMHLALDVGGKENAEKILPVLRSVFDNADIYLDNPGGRFKTNFPVGIAHSDDIKINPEDIDRFEKENGPGSFLKRLESVNLDELKAALAKGHKEAENQGKAANTDLSALVSPKKLQEMVQNGELSRPIDRPGHMAGADEPPMMQLADGTDPRSPAGVAAGTSISKGTQRFS